MAIFNKINQDIRLYLHHDGYKQVQAIGDSCYTVAPQQIQISHELFYQMKILKRAFQHVIYGGNLMMKKNLTSPPTNIRKVRGLRKNTEHKNNLLVNEKGDVGLNASKKYETRDELSSTCNPKVMARFMSVPDATSLYHCYCPHCGLLPVL